MKSSKIDVKSLIGAMIWIFISLSLFIAAFYIDRFWQSKHWDEPASWGSFADYYGGFINPLVGLGNLAFLIYITFLIEKRNDDRNLYTLRHEAMLRLNGLLNAFPPFAIDPDQIAVKYGSAHVSFEQGYYEVQHLFPSNEEDFKALQSVLLNVNGLTVRYFVTKLRDPNQIDIIEKYRSEMIETYSCDFSGARHKFITAIRTSLQ